MRSLTARKPAEQDGPGRPLGREVRALFLSDCHLGSRHARAGELLAFLRSIQPGRVYLAGDIVDGWALRRRWRWTRVETECLRHLLGWGRQGIPLLYAAGNHDNFLSPFFDDFGFALLDHEFQHTTLDGKRYLVVHGDRFDGDLRIPGWKSWLGSAGYDALFELGVWTNHWRRCLGLGPTDFAVRWRKALPAARRHLDAWERASVAHARARQCDGIICGHVHTPRASYIGGLHYLNIGDWMEHGIALVETESGELCHRTVSCPEGRPVAHSVRGVPNPVPTLEVVG